MHLDAITRLRAVNPAVVDPGLGREAVAQATLRRILDSPSEPAAPAARRDRPAGLVEQQPDRGALPRESQLAGRYARSAADPLHCW